MIPDNWKIFGLIAAMAIATSVEGAELAGPAPVPTAAPPTSVGYVTVPSTRQGSLMHLRGMVGQGTAFLRLSGDRGCARMRLRLIAGDFGGLEDSDWGQPVALDIRSSWIVADLMRGIEIISDEVRVSTDPADPLAEIIILNGFQANTGFVINPGASPIANLFGARGRPVNCRAIEALAAGAEG